MEISGITKYTVFGSANGAVAEAVCAALRNPALLRHIEEEDLAPLLYSRLREDNALGGLAGEPAERLEKFFTHSLATQVLYQKVYFGILDILNPEGIEAVPLKGIYLAEKAYPAPGARPMADLDLLVPPEAARRAVELLISNGFKCKMDFAVRDGRLPSSGMTFKSVAMKDAPIDLHYSFINAAGIRAMLISRGQAAALDAGAFASLRKCDYLGREVPELAAHYFMLYLMLHHYSHNFRGTIWFADFLLYTRKTPESEWAAFSRLLRDSGLGRLGWIYMNLAAAKVGCRSEDVFPAAFLSSLVPRGGQDALASAILRTGRLKPFHSLMLIPSASRRSAALLRYLFPSRFYVETVAGRPLNLPQYMAELVKIQTSVLRR